MGTAGPNDRSSRAIVLFDGDCPLCRKSAALLKRLDWLGVLRFSNAREPDNVPNTLDASRLLEQMHLITPRGDRVYVGFEAFRWMAWRLPLLTAFAPLLWLPGVPALGRRAYLWVARNRFRLVPCGEGVCSVPLSRSNSGRSEELRNHEPALRQGTRGW
jgi:predicted DCC family thiol-disulfide oxidoreductase YuxK